MQKGLSVIFVVIVAAVVILVLGLIMISIAGNTPDVKKTLNEEQIRIRGCIQKCRLLESCPDQRIQLCIDEIERECYDVSYCRQDFGAGIGASLTGAGMVGATNNCCII